MTTYEAQLREDARRGGLDEQETEALLRARPDPDAGASGGYEASIREAAARLGATEEEADRLVAARPAPGTQGDGVDQAGERFVAAVLEARGVDPARVGEAVGPQGGQAAVAEGFLRGLEAEGFKVTVSGTGARLTTAPVPGVADDLAVREAAERMGVDLGDLEGDEVMLLEFGLDDRTASTVESALELVKLRQDLGRVLEGITRQFGGGFPAGAVQVQEAFDATVTQGKKASDYRVRLVSAGLTRDGRRLYPADVLREAVAAKKFDGAKMYLGHQDASKTRARGHRDLREWGSTVVPGTVRYDETMQAVIGLVRAHKQDAQEFLSDSVARQAVGVSGDFYVQIERGEVNGRPVDVVRNLSSVESLDWVPAGNAVGLGPVVIG